MVTTAIPQLGVTLKDGMTLITVWAPQAKHVWCRTYNPEIDLPLSPLSYGYWHLVTSKLNAGQRYTFVVDGNEFPDPVSRSQPDGVHKPSEVVDLDFAWTDQYYQAPPLRDFIIYELHVGTFTPNHDFEGIIKRIPHLKALGINAIELMPVAQFPGDRNWGYDGVFSFAVQHSYGGAKKLQELVDACHRADIAVILDVVYNHFGPEGNYLSHYGPYFTDKYHTPWGIAINYDDAWSHGTRDFIRENVLMWFRDFHIDALRLDAVHAIKDFSPQHILQEIRKATDDLMQQNGKQHYLIVECDLNDKRYLEPLEKNGFAMDAQWLDEFHHALRVAAGEDKKGYYKEFEGVTDLAKAYEQAYVFNGNYSTHRHKFFGSSADGMPGEKFVVFSQNHDQVGNRMVGERSSVLFSQDMQRLTAMATILSPFVPLLFMGEEWGARTPFLYFVSHSDQDLIEAVRKGRREEFADFHGEGEVPDPQAEDTFNKSILDWQELTKDHHPLMLRYYTALIGLRKSHTVFQNMSREHLQVTCFPPQASLLLTITYEDTTVACFLNFSKSCQEVLFPIAGLWHKIWDTADPAWGGSSNTPYTCSKECIVSAESGVVFQTGNTEFLPHPFSYPNNILSLDE